MTIVSDRWGFSASKRTCILLAVAVLCAAGCTGPRAARAPASTDETPGMTLEVTARAEALARYSQGLLCESDRDFEGALSNFTAVAKLDPYHEGLHIRIAILLLQQKRQDDAVKLLEQYVKRVPNSEKALTLLAIIYRAAENLPRAVQAYQRLIKAFPENQEAYVELAGLYLRTDRAKHAIELLEQASRRVPEPGELLRALGSLYVQQATPETLERNRKAAIAAFERALQLTPKDISLMFVLGELHIRLDEFENALQYFNRIEDIAPDNLKIKQRLAEAFLHGGEQDAVIARLQPLAAQAAIPERVYYYIGDLYESAQDDLKAEEFYKKAASGTHPQSAAFVKMAARMSREDVEKAADVLRSGLEKLPDNAQLLEMLALVYFSQEQYAKSIEYFEVALKNADADPESEINPLFLFNYALAAQRTADLDLAATLLNRAIEKNPAFLDAYLQFAFRQDGESLRHDSIAVLEKMGELQPGEPNVYVYLGLLNSYLKSYAQALAAFEKAESLVQDSPQQADLLDASFYFWYAAAAERMKDTKRAEQLFQKCLELDPEHAEALNYLAYMWAEQGVELDRALDLVQRALKINPASGAFIDTLGWIYYMQGNYDKALTEINRAAELIPDDPTILDHLGDVFFKLGDEEQAIPHWKRAFVLDPDSESVAEKLLSHGVDLDALRAEAAELKERIAEEKKKQAEANRLIGLPEDGEWMPPVELLDEEEE